VKEATDLAALQQLNENLDPDAIRVRGRISLPDPFGRSVDIDLSGTFRNREVLIDEYWHFHPRFLFFKSTLENARLADLGAGSGGMMSWRHWGVPARTDLQMYAVDITKGQFFDQYVDYDVVVLGETKTKFSDGFFDAFVLSHIVEHIENRPHFAAEVARLARPGARMYIEWPSTWSGRSVSRSALESLGIHSSTLNFFDDPTHLELLSIDDVELLFRRKGFTTVNSGTITNDYLAPELFRCGYAEADPETTTYALWLMFRFSTYLIMEMT
jgi:SAM-dependent methyltransferase